MVPDYISEKKMLELKVDRNGDGPLLPLHGLPQLPDARMSTKDGKPKYYGRFNQGVVTINLPDVALSSGGNVEKFWQIFDERMELCHRALHVPPRAAEGHAVGRRAHPMAVRRAARA